MQIKLDEDIVTTILTNHHVLKSEEMAAEASTTFNYDGRGEPMVIKLCPNIFFRTSQVRFCSCLIPKYFFCSQTSEILRKPPSILIKYNTTGTPKIDNMINFYFYVSTIL